MPSTSPYAEGLEKQTVNNVPLTPLSFLFRAARVCPERVSVVHGARRFTWRDTAKRCRRLASALAQAGVAVGDTVAVIAANTPEAIEVHFGAPLCGAVLNMLNTRLDPATLAFMVRHGEAKVLIADTEFSPLVRAALALLDNPPLVIDISDPEGPGGARIGALDYEAFIAGGDPEYAGRGPEDEWQPIALNYTSGTTGNPKGVVYHHRGAYLAALSNILDWGMPRHPVLLWTLPLFHCNGWCLAWSLAAVAGTNICLRRVEAQRILSLIRTHRVTHYGGAPVVHSLLAMAPDAWKQGISHRVEALIGGSPPSVPVIAALECMGFSITQIYGLTEVFGPSVVCAEQPDWAGLPVDALAERKSRQGVGYTAQEHVAVLNPVTMEPVPADGVAQGEVMFRGNMTMLGYLKNRQATQEAFAGGWFHSGDLAVVQPDGYIQIRDRAKDVIISGGENINSLEVEEVLHSHPAVLCAAVVARPDEKWGETPCAFVELKAGASANAADLIAYCRDRLAHFKAPRYVVIGELPKTATGKIQKSVLRSRVAPAAS